MLDFGNSLFDFGKILLDFDNKLLDFDNKLLDFGKIISKTGNFLLDQYIISILTYQCYINILRSILTIYCKQHFNIDIDFAAR